MFRCFSRLTSCVMSMLNRTSCKSFCKVVLRCLWKLLKSGFAQNSSCVRTRVSSEINFLAELFSLLGNHVIMLLNRVVADWNLRVIPEVKRLLSSACAYFIDELNASSNYWRVLALRSYVLSISFIWARIMIKPKSSLSSWRNIT